MISISRCALTAFFRFSINDDDAPTASDLNEAQAHWDSSFGPFLLATMSQFQIEDTPDNRAMVQLLAAMAPGSNRAALTHGCRLFANVLKLPADSAPLIATDVNN